MSTIATTAQTADSIDYWVPRHLFHYCHRAHPSKSAVCNIGSNTTVGTKSRGRSN